jgi:hypothetical protein
MQVTLHKTDTGQEDLFYRQPGITYSLAETFLSKLKNRVVQVASLALLPFMVRSFSTFFKSPQLHEA